MANEKRRLEPCAIVILAAGLGKRMNSELPKVLVETRERPMIQHVLESACALEPSRLVVVTGYKRQLVEEGVQRFIGQAFPSCSVTFAEQVTQCGTGDAVRSALSNLVGFVGAVLIICGDTPLVRAETLRTLLESHQDAKATVSLISFLTSSPNSLGRIIRDPDSQRVRLIREVKDCSPAELRLNEVNSGIYAVDSAFLAPAVSELTQNNAQKEYYLTDIVERADKEGQTVNAIVLPDAEELQGVNTLHDLALINCSLNARKVRALINSGVIVDDVGSLTVDSQVTIAPGARIGPQVQLRGTTTIGPEVEVEGTALLIDCVVERGAHIKLGVRAEGSTIGPGAQVGPFANIRPGTTLGEGAKVGNFVETKQAVLGREAKASHLTYLGDCQVGDYANIGAGTITCNYDGVKKSRTTIGRGAFVGSDSCLVAPVNIGDGAFIGAGSVITKDVEADSLALSRAPQIQRPGWAKSRKNRKG